jgi:twitching motility two-component system response regulator PilG
MLTIADKLRVLVVDDSKTIRQVVEKILSKAQCDIVTAADGFEALSLVIDFRPDVVLLDIMMPRLNGYEVCALIKHNQRLKHIPVILLSSKEGLFDQAKGRVVGCDGYVTKPFRHTDLLNGIKKIVGTSQS